ncbi:MAG: redoxin domain-containing protein [Zetaproteobacteria bacterium]|nr:redoxin domain-containing protein [Zetaproteobacteria bacterium]
MKTPAYLILRCISFLLVALGLALLSFSIEILVSNEIITAKNSMVMLSLGALFLLVGTVGPVRVIYKGAQLPIEIKRTILVQAGVLPLSGIAFIFAGVIDTPTYGVWAVFIVGILSLLSALAGFYPLSKKLPATFYIGEMLSIIKSAGVSGNKEDSLADQAFTRWTHGREGVPVGNKAPNGTVITMNGEEVSLSSFFGDKPLVLNFGSYSCPHHRKRMGELRTLMQAWQNNGVDFLTVYTAEAHTEDGWKLVDQYICDVEYTNEDDFCFSYAKNIHDRKKMAAWLIDKKHFEMPLVLDSMENDLLNAYNSWPIRLYIIHEAKVVYCGDQGPFGYEPAKVDMVLKEIMAQNV